MGVSDHNKSLGGKISIPSRKKFWRTIIVTVQAPSLTTTLGANDLNLFYQLLSSMGIL